MLTQTVKGPAGIRGRFTPPGDKSVSHRALMFGALADGTSRYSNFLEAEDCLNTLSAFRAMGVRIEWTKGSGQITVHGAGLRGLKEPGSELYLGNSGTTMRLLLGILAGQRLQAVLTGDPSLSKRPMRRVTDPLKKMGAQIKGADNGNFAPLTIRGGQLKAIEYENVLGSAQVKSAILFAGLYAEGETRIHEVIASRDHTERMLRACGAPFESEDGWLKIRAAQSLRPIEAVIPGDLSTAAFFITAAAMQPGSELTAVNVSLNPTRTGILNVLERMGARVECEKIQDSPEPVGNVHIKGARLRGTGITGPEIPGLIDELPILMVAMALAEGESLISGAAELRVKETDRIHSMVTNLNAIGGDLDELPDGCLIRGVESFKGGTVESFGDHRTAMSLAIAALTLKGQVEIRDTACIATSFPDFFRELERLRA